MINKVERLLQHLSLLRKHLSRSSKIFNLFRWGRNGITDVNNNVNNEKLYAYVRETMTSNRTKVNDEVNLASKIGKL